MEKERIAFAVVMSHLFDNSVNEGAIVDLILEPENPFDQDAILIKHEGKPVGYVPNIGNFCEKCNKKTSNKYHCEHCGNPEIRKGGMASFLKRNNLLKDCVGVVYEIRKNVPLVELFYKD